MANSRQSFEEFQRYNSKKIVAKQLPEQDVFGRGLLHKSSNVFSYSGSDIICVIYIPAQKNNAKNITGFIEIEDRLQTITVSSARSVMPVRRLGETTPTSYTRGSRTIAGSMVFTTGLRDAFVDYISKSIKDGEPIRESVLFVDQLPKFSMILQASNELGGASSALLVNITLTNFGTTFSIDDIYTESTFTYVAEQYFPLSRTGADIKNEVKDIIRKNTFTFDQETDLTSLLETMDYNDSTDVF